MSRLTTSNQNNMKILSKTYNICLILFTLSLIACNSPAYISGRIEAVENKGSRIYLIEPLTLREVAGSYLGKVIDTAIIRSDGSFEFQHPPKTKDPVMLELAVQPSGSAPNYLQVDDPAGSNYMPIVWQWGEKLQITARWDQFQKSFSIEHPSEINKALSDLRDINQEAYQTYLAGKEWELEDGSQLLEKEEAILHYQKQLIAFANSTPYLMPALVAMRWVSPVSNYERVPEFLVDLCNKWKKSEPNHPWVTALCQESDPSNLPVLVGAVFPNLRLPMISGDTLSLSDALGKRLTIIDLWASWCGPCRKENRDVLIPLWNEYHDKGFKIIAIGLESDASSWREAVERDGTSGWFQASHVKGDEEPLFKLMRVQTIPANFIVDSQGVVLAKNIHGTALSDWVKSYLKK